MEKLQSQRERRKRRERTSGSHSFTHNFSTCSISSCCEPPTHPPPCCGMGIFPMSQSKQSPGRFLQGAIGRVHLHMGGPMLRWEKHFPSAGANGQVPSWPVCSWARLWQLQKILLLGDTGEARNLRPLPGPYTSGHSLWVVYASPSCSCWGMELSVALHTSGRADRLQMVGTVPYRRVKS